MPEMTPEQVVLRFYSLVKDGGKLSVKEAFTMVSEKYSQIDPNTFRKWTQDFDPKSEVKIVDTIIADKPNENGDIVATVKLDVLTVSSFGGKFASSSKMNLILNEEENKWELDFIAQTIDEKDFRSAPKDARVEVEPLEPAKK